MKPTWSCILFDLDGTIVDSAPGITASLAWTYEKLGRTIPTPSELLTFVGPPILDAFRNHSGMTLAEAEHALSVYRPHYREVGVYDAKVYPGVPEVLKAIHDSGIPLSLATSKPESLAQVVLDHFGLSQYFTFMTGASEDEKRSAKKDVVAYALQRLKKAGHDVSRPVMVGDRIHDVEGAKSEGVPTIFVRWGYGSPAEEVGAIAVATTAEQVQELLLG